MVLVAMNPAAAAEAWCLGRAVRAETTSNKVGLAVIPDKEVWAAATLDKVDWVATTLDKVARAATTLGKVARVAVSRNAQHHPIARSPAAIVSSAPVRTSVAAFKLCLLEQSSLRKLLATATSSSATASETR